MMLVVKAGAIRRFENEHNGRVRLAHDTAALSRVKRLPPIKSLLWDSSKAQPKARTWQQQLRVARQIAGVAPRRKRTKPEASTITP